MCWLGRSESRIGSKPFEFVKSGNTVGGVEGGTLLPSTGSLRRQIVFWLIWGLLLLSSMMVAQESSRDLRDPRGPGTIEMVRLLESLIQQSEPMENRFLN